MTIDLARKHLLDEGPLAYFKNHGSVSIFLVELMEIHFGLKSDETVQRLKVKSFGDDSSSRMHLMDYLLSKAPQI